MKKMNVLHITYDMRIGGTEQVIKNLILGSDNTLFNMSILCIESPLGPFADELLAVAIPISALSRQPGFDRALVTQIREHIKLHNIQVVHCHQYTPYIYGVLGSIFTDAKVIFTEHGRFYPDSSSWKRKLINPILNKFTAATTAISAATKDALVYFENIPNKDIRIVYNGIAQVKIDQKQVIALKQKLNISEGQICLGTIARLDPIKNHRMMLEAFKLVLDTGANVKLIIVGDGDERGNIENTIRKLALEQHVILTGYEPAPQAFLVLMDIYLLSSLSEGTSMTLLEAMSIGKPCVVTDAGGNPEIIQDQINGLVSENNNAQAFAKSIITLINTPDKMAEIHKANLNRFNQLFSSKSMCEQYQTLYLNL